MKNFLILVIALLFIHAENLAQLKFESDNFPTSAGNLKITFIGHASLMMEFHGKVIQIDPWTSEADYTRLPKADIILVTHHHADHFDSSAIRILTKKNTELLLTATCRNMIGKGTVMTVGDQKKIKGILIQSVYAYNLVHLDDNGKPYHEKGKCNGYVLTFGNKRVYVAGDTEDIPEMKNLPPIDVAFLPMNLPYTMTPDMVKNCVTMLKPKILYPYHFGSMEYAEDLATQLKNDKGTEVRIRKFE